VPDAPEKVSACHCIACQRRTGAPLGVSAAYNSADVVIAGASTAFQRPTASGGTSTFHFCPVCGTTVYWNSHKFPRLTGVAVGAFADPAFPAPVRSVWEQTRHDWVYVGTADEHYPQGKHAPKM
jgi:hypothetical protein